jgi:hypothetical protein
MQANKIAHTITIPAQAIMANSLCKLKVSALSVPQPRQPIGHSLAPDNLYLPKASAMLAVVAPNIFIFGELLHVYEKTRSST